MFDKIICLIEAIMSEPPFVIFSGLFGIFGTFFGLWSHFYNNKRKVFSCATSTYNVIRDGQSFLNDIEITHNRNPITTLTVTNFAIWNSGNKMIEPSDIVNSKPLRIYVNDDAKILSAKVTEVIDPTNMFNVIQDPNNDNSVQVTFDYVDCKDGAIIQIVHTGSSNSLSFTYQIKGGKYIKASKKKQTNAFNRLMDKLYSKHSDLAYMILLSLYVLLVQYLQFPSYTTGVKLFTFLSDFLLIVLIIFFILNKYSLQIPNKLRSYREH